MSVALRAVRRMVEVSGGEVVGGVDKFHQVIGRLDDESEQEEEIGEEGENMPPDWKTIFGSNGEDNFRFGVQITPSRGKRVRVEEEKTMKTPHIKLFSEFYSSDLIVASPLGLVTAGFSNKKHSGGNSEEQEEDGRFDYLGSIEQLFIHQVLSLFFI